MNGDVCRKIFQSNVISPPHPPPYPLVNTKLHWNKRKILLEKEG